MRARLLAIVILLIIVGWPSYAYWYFYKRNISSIIFVSQGDESFTISLEWTLKYEYFPLLDQAFQYKSTCIGSCIFSPIPPLEYNLRITTTGREDITDVIKLGTWENKKYQVILPEVLVTEKIWSLPHALPDVKEEWYTPIWVSSRGNIVAYDSTNDTREVWIIKSWKFIGLFRSQSPLDSAYMDSTKSFLIVPDSSGKQSLYPLLWTEPGIVFPHPEKIRFVSMIENIWKVQAWDTLYEYVNANWKINPRFTDYIDLSSKYRLGFISKNQSKKLSLQNLDRDHSVLVLLDRSSNKLTILKRWEIQGFLMYDWLPAYLDSEWNIYRVELR